MRRSEFRLGRVNGVIFQYDLLDFLNQRLRFESRLPNITLLLKVRLSEETIFCSSRHNSTLELSIVPLMAVYIVKGSWGQAGAIRRRYSQVAKKSLSQSLYPWIL